MSIPQNNYVQKDVTAQNTFSDAIRIANRKFNIEVYGAISSTTVVLQRKDPSESASAYRDVDSFTTLGSRIGESIGVWDYRIGVKTGGYGSGTTKLMLSY